jgi:hypothetical protein
MQASAERTPADDTACGDQERHFSSIGQVFEKIHATNINASKNPATQILSVSAKVSNSPYQHLRC